MKDLVRSLRVSGLPVPVPWVGLEKIIRPRTQSVMIAMAASGVGKSALALEWAVRLDRPVLYLSLDTALVDHAIRLLARKTGLTIEEVERGHDIDLETWAERWETEIAELGFQTRFFDQSLQVREISELIAAEAEYWGEPPSLVVVDNLMNLIEHEESAAEYRRIVGELVKAARENNTLILALHHLRRRPAKARGEDGDETTQPVHLTDSLYAVDQEAKYVLGLWRPYPNRLQIGVLKNRMGGCSPRGDLSVSLDIDLRRMVITDEFYAANRIRRQYAEAIP